MDWFNGTVDEALKEYQQKNGILLVYLSDQASIDASTEVFNKLWSEFDVSIFESVKSKVVAIRLDKNSSGALQFSEFFPTPVFPVCYVIGLNGQPLEVITTVEELTAERFNKALTKSIELYKNQLVEKKDQVVDDHSLIENISELDSAQNNSDTSAMTLEEKVNYARKILEEKRIKDEEKTKNEQKEKELLRRNEGKLLAEIREKNREKELKDIVDARRKEKQADQLALKKLREQIQHDKEERAKKNTGEASLQQSVLQEQPNPVANVSNPITKCNECRIQCRFPDGTNLIKVFLPSSPLQAVIDLINEDARKPSSFMIIQSYPRRTLGEPNYVKTLEELGLTPSSTLLIVPNKTS